MTRGSLRFTEEQYRAHAAKSDRFKVGHTTSGSASARSHESAGESPMQASYGSVAGVATGPLTPQRPPDHSSRPLLPARGAPIKDAVWDECYAASILLPEREHRFHPHRKWRFDYAWINAKIALEVEGGVWTQGRHTRGAGFLADMEKYNAAVLLGWRVLRTTPDKLADGVKSVRLLMLA